MPSVKYIKRNGRVFGPYLYQSVRKGKKVTSIYLGKRIEEGTAVIRKEKGKAGLKARERRLR